MRELKLTCDKFNFISVLDVAGHKTINDHATFYLKGHIAAEDDEAVFRNSAGEGVTITASGPDGSCTLFNGMIDSIEIHAEHDLRVLTLNLVSRSVLMDLLPKTRTFQDVTMTYQAVTDIIEAENKNFSFIWPSDGNRPIELMMVQYQETDWQYANRLAGRIGTVVIPDYLLDTPYLSIGMTKRPTKSGIDAISYTMNKNVKQFRDRQKIGVFPERDDISYIVKSRDIFDLCDPIPFLDLVLYVHTIETKYEGNELVHYYTLKESSGFYSNPRQNNHLIGGSLCGTVRTIQHDQVQVEIHGDTPQTNYQWFPYATPFSQPDGCGWYFMPEIGDEVRVQFPSAYEYDAYVSSAVHVSHGNRFEPETKFIRTIYGQVIQFDPDQILIRDGVGSSIAIYKDQGISMETVKSVNIDATEDVTVSAFGKVTIVGQGGVVLQKGSSVVSVDDAIDISSEHTRIQ